MNVIKNQHGLYFNGFVSFGMRHNPKFDIEHALFIHNLELSETLEDLKKFPEHQIQVFSVKLEYIEYKHA